MIATIPEAVFSLAVAGLAASVVSLVPMFLRATFGIELRWPKRGNTRNKPTPMDEPPAPSVSKLHTLHWPNGARWGIISQQPIPAESRTR